MSLLLEAPLGRHFAQFHRDHDTLVEKYVLELFASGADPNTAAAAASSDLGKPVPTANVEIAVDQTSLFEPLPAGTYIATVSAIGTDGTVARSVAVTFVR